MIFPAMKTGLLTVINGAMARELTVDSNGKVNGVSYVDKASRTEKTIRAKAVIVAASACESARLLLNSKSSKYPNGLANGSGQVGRNLTDTVGHAVSGTIPALEGMPHHNSDGIGGMHVYIPWWELEKKNKDFPRGYHVEIGGGYGMPQIGSFRGVAARAEGYGPRLKDEIRRYYGTQVNFAGRGEMIPNKDSFMEIDPTQVDQWGIPVPRFHWKWSDNELKMVKHMHNTFKQLIETMGGKVNSPDLPDDLGKAISAGGEIIHEAGTCRMGDDPRTSVLNKWSAAHESPNLLVVDAAPFNGNPDKNVTLSIIANAWRAVDHLAGEIKKGNV
jgi:choline dehydrogenase-like flavoprotein